MPQPAACWAWSLSAANGDRPRRFAIGSPPTKPERPRWPNTSTVGPAWAIPPTITGRSLCGASSKELKPEAAAHLTMVTQLDPQPRGRLEAPRVQETRIGAGSPIEQLAAEKAEAEARRKADKRLDDSPARVAERAGRQVEAGQGDRGPGGDHGSARGAGGLDDLRPATRPSANRGPSPGTDRFARLDAGTGAPGHRQRIGRRAKQGDRNAAPPRPARNRVPPGRHLAATPELDPDPILYHYFLQPIGWDSIGSPGFLFVQGSQYDVLRTYTVDESRTDRRSLGRCIDHGYQ